MCGVMADQATDYRLQRGLITVTRQIFCHMTATAVKWDDEYQDYPNERHGWIDRNWSRTVLFDSRNDTRPLINEPEDSEDLADEIRDVMGEYGWWENNGDGTFYERDSYPESDGWHYSYAIHFTVKYNGEFGWTEAAWNPVTEGIVI